MRACEFEDRMTSERGFLDGLQRATHYEIAGRKLILSNGGEVLLEFDAVTK
jgi:heat shock protein HslJ